MDKATKEKLLERNQRIIDMVIERAKRDFPDDIDLIGLTGSFATGDYHEGSDLDLIIVNGTDRGWGIADGFILGGVGFDVYCTPWDNLERKSRLDDVGVSSLTELQILYVAKPEHLERFKALRQRALDGLAEPIGRDCLERAGKHLDMAKQELGGAMLAETTGRARYAAGGVLHHCVNALIAMNNTCIKRGIRRYREILLALEHLPDGFEALYMAVIEAKTADASREAARALLGAVAGLHTALWEGAVEKSAPNYDNLWGVYEEFFSNYFNKLRNSAAEGDASYAFFAALGAQAYIDEMADMKGLPVRDLMAAFDPGDLTKLEAAWEEAARIYLDAYKRAGREVERFDTFEALYDHYMHR